MHPPAVRWESSGTQATRICRAWMDLVMANHGMAMLEMAVGHRPYDAEAFGHHHRMAAAGQHVINEVMGKVMPPGSGAFVNSIDGRGQRVLAEHALQNSVTPEEREHNRWLLAGAMIRESAHTGCRAVNTRRRLLAQRAVMAVV